MRALRRILSCASLLVFVVTSAAHADEGKAAAAEALFEAGRAAVLKGNFEAACPRFRESQRLDPGAGTLLNLADCEERLGHLAEAWDAWKEAVASLAPGDDRIPAAEARAKAIDARVPRLTLLRGRPLPEGAIVRRDDVEIHDAAFDVSLPVDPGTHTIVVTAPGRKAATLAVSLKEGESVHLSVEAGAPLETRAPAPSAQLAPLPPQEGSPALPASGGAPWRRVGFVAGIAGIVSMGVGGAFGIAAIGDKATVNSACTPSGCQAPGVDAARSGRTNAIASDVGFGVGVALLATGVALVLTHERAKNPAPSAARIAPAFLPVARGCAGGFQVEF